jgi:hypothetical protein
MNLNCLESNWEKSRVFGEASGAGEKRAQADGKRGSIHKLTQARYRINCTLESLFTSSHDRSATPKTFARLQTDPQILLAFARAFRRSRPIH